MGIGTGRATGCREDLHGTGALAASGPPRLGLRSAFRSIELARMTDHHCHWPTRPRVLSPGTLGDMKLHVGCAMWSYAPWQGRYLPRALQPRDRLMPFTARRNPPVANQTF